MSGIVCPTLSSPFVIRAKAEIHVACLIQSRNDGWNPLSHAWERVRASVLRKSIGDCKTWYPWIPAFAGMTVEESPKYFNATAALPTA
mgnify:CR=1 FL=1|jgi:hypothetical protein